MSRRTVYRRQLLRAVEAFLEGTASSRARAQRIIRRCHTAIRSEAAEATLDWLMWEFFIAALGDSVYYESESYLQETRDLLLGHSSANIARVVISEDFRAVFTADEAEWYAQLLSMAEFVTTIPFAKVHQATFATWQHRIPWSTMRATIPEVEQVEEIEADYRRRKQMIEAIAATSPAPENMGDEKIYHVVLREVTSLLAGIRIGRPIIRYGYPTPDIPYRGDDLDMLESVKWTKRALAALAGEGTLFLSCRFSKAATFGADVLLLSLY